MAMSTIKSYSPYVTKQITSACEIRKESEGAVMAQRMGELPHSVNIGDHICIKTATPCGNGGKTTKRRMMRVVGIFRHFVLMVSNRGVRECFVWPDVLAALQGKELWEAKER